MLSYRICGTRRLGVWEYQPVCVYGCEWKARQVAWNEVRCMAWKEGEGRGVEQGGVGLAGGIQLHNVLHRDSTFNLGLYLRIDHLLLPCKPPRCPKGTTIHLQTHGLLLQGRVRLMPLITALPTAKTGGNIHLSPAETPQHHLFAWNPARTNARLLKGARLPRSQAFLLTQYHPQPLPQ